MSQKDLILESLNKGESITSLDAVLKFQTIKLTTRISELRQRGIPIKDKWESRNGKTFKRYFIDEKDRKND